MYIYIKSKWKRARDMEQVGESGKKRETERKKRVKLNPGLFARSKWRSAVILKFSWKRGMGGRWDRIKKSEWKLVSHDNRQPAERTGTDAFSRFSIPASFSPLTTYTPPNLFLTP